MCNIVEEIICDIVKVHKVGTNAKVDNKCFVYLIINFSHHYVSVAELISQQLL